MTSADQVPALEPLALLEGTAFVSDEGSGRSAARVMAELAVRHGGEPFTEIDIHAVETSVPISALYEHAWRLVPLLASATNDESTVAVVFVERALDHVPAAWACIFSGTTFLPWGCSPLSAGEPETKAKLELMSGRIGRPVLLTTQALSRRLDLGASDAFASIILVDDPAVHDGASSEPYAFTDPVELLGEGDGGGSAYLVQTSGSSGTPKLVEVTFECMLDRLALIDMGESKWHWVLPLDAAFSPFYQLFARPDGLVYMGPERSFADPLGVLRLIEKNRIEFFGATNSFFAKLIDALDRQSFEGDLSCLRSVQFAGEKITPEVTAGIRERLESVGARDFEVRFRYGSSEAGSISMVSDRELAAESTGWTMPDVVPQGPPCAGTDVRIVDDDGTVVRHGEVGRIEIRSASQMFSRYHADPESTSEAFTADGWFRTGDLGVVDRSGLTVVGRESGMIIANGRNLSLAEIDAHLLGVAGVKHQLVTSAPVRTLGSQTEELAVFFVPSDGSEAGLSQICGEIRRTVSQSSGITAKHLIAVAEQDWARTRTGKVDRNALVSGFERGAWSAVQTTSADPARVAVGGRFSPRWLSNLWRHVLELGDDEDTAGSFFDAGGDSLKSAELMISIERESGVEVSAQRFFENPVLANLVALVEEAMAVAAPGDLVGAGSARELMHRLEATIGSWSGERRSGASLVVGANTSGGRAPIVWVCRSKHEFDLLAEALGPDQPLHGLRSLEDLVSVDDLTSGMLDTVAERYLGEILVLGLGPRLVIGGSGPGAVVALALARKARQVASEPSPLVLQDWAFTFGRYEGPVLLLQRVGEELPTPGAESGARADFPAAETRVLGGRAGQHFDEASLPALAAQLRRLTGGSGARHAAAQAGKQLARRVTDRFRR